MKPHIAATSCCKVELEKDKTYFYCTCGRSANQPFCDGTHKGGTFAPLSFEVKEDGRYALCQCKHTKDSPFCDGSHKPLRAAAQESKDSPEESA